MEEGREKESVNNQFPYERKRERRGGAGGVVGKWW
jgi:hypothetical protein